jgi:hypothetical protein
MNPIKAPAAQWIDNITSAVADELYGRVDPSTVAFYVSMAWEQLHRVYKAQDRRYGLLTHMWLKAAQEHVFERLDDDAGNPPC